MPEASASGLHPGGGGRWDVAVPMGGGRDLPEGTFPDGDISSHHQSLPRGDTQTSALNTIFTNMVSPSGPDSSPDFPLTVALEYLNTSHTCSKLASAFQVLLRPKAERQQQTPVLLDVPLSLVGAQGGLPQNVRPRRID